MKRLVSLAAASLIALASASAPALAQYQDTQAPQETRPDTGSAVQENAPQPQPMGVDNFVTKSVDNTFGLLTTGKGQTGIGVCPDTDQPRTADATNGMGAACE